MTVTPEELAAFADGQLEGADKARVAAAVEADPKLEKQVAAHRALAGRLSAHFAPILDQPVPGRLAGLLTPAADAQAQSDNPAELVDFVAAKARAESKKRLPGWSWGGGAIAAALVAAVVLNTGDGTQPGAYADARLAAVLDTQLVAQQSDSADLRILLSFRNKSGEFCRAYSQADASGIACRDARGWRAEAIGEGAGGNGGEFRMAGSESDILAAAQEMAASDALTAEEEAKAQAAGWRD